MSDTWRENAIVQAIDIITNKKVAQASFDKTIKAVVVQILDKAIGKYQLKYQDSTFQAYATNPNVYYEQEQEVFVLVPGNDWTRVKTIVGGVKNTPTTYNEIPRISQKYNQIGPNSISSGIIELCSYQTVFYDVYNINSEDNILNINQQSAKKYIKEGNGLVLGMDVQTNLDSAQGGGEYGLVFNLRFTPANGEEDAAVRSYILSSSNLIGNPYLVSKPTSVEKLEKDIITDRFECVQSIQVFCRNFYHSDENKPADIFLSNIRLNGAEILSDNDLSNYILHIGYYDKNGNVISSEYPNVTLTAELKIGGIPITENVEYYWFRQNGMIVSGNPKYSNLAGDGWECLNNFENSKPIKQTQNQMIFTSNENFDYPPLTAVSIEKNTKVRCVAVCGNIKINGECNVLNNNLIDVYINSSDKQRATDVNKVDYYLDAGRPTLTCLVTLPLETVPDNPENYNYKWIVIPARGDSIQKQEDKEFIQKYNETRGRSQDAAAKLALMSPADIEKYEQTQEYKAIEEFDEIKNNEFIEGHIYHNFPINSITQYSKIVCAVTDKEGNYKGSGDITLYNHPQVDGMYTLDINNGTQVFQYDKKGNSPTSPQLEKPITILPLSFTLLDSEGNQVTPQQIMANGYIEWLIPKQNTLLIADGKNGKPLDPLTVMGTDIALSVDYDIYKNKPTFYYSLEPVYDSKKTNNDIRLDIKYGDLSFTTYTDFTFPKDGDPGTNGTDYVGKIVPIDSSSSTLDTDRVYIDVLGNKYTDNGYPVDKLKFQLYNNSNIVSNTANFWTCPPITSLSEDKQDNTSFNSYIQQYNNDGSFGLKVSTFDDVEDKKPVDIIRAQYGTGNDSKYFAEYPICFVYLTKGNRNYRLKVKPKTGFKYVVYAEDGSSPDYDNTLPFEIIIEQNILIQDGINCYIAQPPENFQYNWSIIGQLDEIDVNDNKGTFKPKDQFDSSDLTTAIVVYVYPKNIEINPQNKTENLIGYIHIPIYMIVNRYGHSALNSWDGNTIQLNAHGDTILAPQIGAGKKGEDNSFTGILMGDVKSGDKTETGLMGYAKGQRSIFLDSQTGNAIFGKNGAGQIKIDATTNEGTISSGDYNYKDSDHTGTGMKIKFSSTGSGTEQGPYIRFGSNRFSVDANGSIHAAGDGDIAGWRISDDALYKHDGTNKTGMRSGSDPAFYAGINNQDVGSYNFYVNHNGYLFSKSGNIAGWNINKQSLYKQVVIDENTKSWVGINSNADSEDSAYKVTGHKAKAFFANENNFYVTHDGYLRSTSGQIANWNINNESLANDLTGLGKLAVSETNICNSFGETNNKGKGGATARIWNYQNSAGNKDDLSFMLTASGWLYSKIGRIGGWAIDKTSLSSGNLKMNSEGSITGGSPGSSHWAINADGTATFKMLNVTGNSIKLGPDGPNQIVITPDSFKAGNVFNYNVTSNGSDDGGGSGTGSLDSSRTRVRNTSDKKLQVADTLQEWGKKIVQKYVAAYLAQFGTAAVSTLVIYESADIDFDAGTITYGTPLISLSKDGIKVKSGQGAVAGRTGKLTFSDGTYMNITNGIITYVGEGTNSSTDWVGD